MTSVNPFRVVPEGPLPTPLRRAGGTPALTLFFGMGIGGAAMAAGIVIGIELCRAL